MARVLSLDDCIPPHEAFDRLSPRAEGAALFESSESSAPAGRVSLVLPQPLLRLTLEDGRFRARALHERAAPLLERFEPGPIPEPPIEGTDRERLRAPGVLDALRAMLRSVEDEDVEDAKLLPPVVAGLFGFELVRHFEPSLGPNPLETDPELDVVLALDGIVYDHRAGEVAVVCREIDGETDGARQRLGELCGLLRGPSESVVLPPCPTVLPELRGTDVLMESVEEVLRHVRGGEVFQTVIAHRHVVRSDADPFEVYRRLVAHNPSPHQFFLETSRGQLLGASPETAVVVRGRSVHVSPIAGTRPRGRTPGGEIDQEVDARLAIALQSDAKEMAEHSMLVDLARNDLARIAIPGTRKIDGPPHIERYSHVQHLVSNVRAELSPELDALHAYAACANMGTLTGAPKVPATALLRKLEPVGRGSYGGAVGILSGSGDLTTAICIRALEHRSGEYRLQAGAGVVEASVPERELEEIRHKLGAPYSALMAVEEGR